MRRSLSFSETGQDFPPNSFSTHWPPASVHASVHERGPSGTSHTGTKSSVDGLAVGIRDGEGLGESDGAMVGLDGDSLGERDGDPLGLLDGVADGANVGLSATVGGDVVSHGHIRTAMATAPLSVIVPSTVSLKSSVIFWSQCSAGSAASGIFQ